MIDDEQLILLVQANECLYNKYSPGCKLADHKKAVWNRIAQEMKLPDELCIKRWACLRDRQTSVPKTNSPLPEAEPQNSFEPILPEPTTPVPNVQKRKRKAPEDLDNSISEAVGALKKLCEEKCGRSKEEENNPLHGFGRMIVATISSMSASQQIKAMNRVTTLVMEMKLNPFFFSIKIL